MSLPLAHLEHWLWILYVIPVVIVALGLINMSWLERRRERDQR